MAERGCWCGAEQASFFWEGPLERRNIGSAKLIRCAQCHTVRTARVEDAKAPSGDGVEGSYFHKEPASWDGPNARQVLRYLPSGSVLDIGCNTGHLMRFLADGGLHVQGLEPNVRAVEFARSMGLNVIQGFFDGSHQWERQFDAVVMSHVLEHIAQPVRFLKQAAGLLRDGGYIFVFVPNIAALRAAYRLDTWAPLNPQDHIWHWDKPSLVSLARSAGLTVVSVHAVDLYQGYGRGSFKGWIRRAAVRLGQGEQLAAVLQRA